MSAVRWLCLGLMGSATFILIAVRCWFLAPTRIGCLFYFLNVAYDIVWRRLGKSRALVDATLGLVLFGCTAALRSIEAGYFAILAGFVILALELVSRERERKIALSSWALPSPRHSPRDCDSERSAKGMVPHPSWHPRLTVNLEGPVICRLPHYDLGTLVPGRRLSITLLVANHSTVPAQLPVEVVCSPGGGLQVEGAYDAEGPVLKSGDVWRRDLTLQVCGPCQDGKVTIEVRCGQFRQALQIRFSSTSEVRHVASARIERYPGGCRSAFSWRGDMDHYDTVTFQSVEGLKASLGLAARYRMPQTMYLSSRLTLDRAEAERFYRQFGVNRGQDHVDEFIAWMRESVDLQHRASYPFESTMPYLMELGNHMHLHYGTDAAADEGNNWSRGAGIGAGEYAWQGGERGSFAEQRDNALKARALFERHFGFTPRSWAMPDSTRDEHTPRAVEAAGCEVLSDSDARHVDNVVFQPPPHHPPGCRAVELTKRYPGDPEDWVHAAMIVYWLHRAWRRGIPVVFMCHQHMRQFAGHACARFTEYILRYVLNRFNGDLHINTVYGIGHYWEQVLCPEHRVVEVTVRDGIVTVTNKGSEALAQIPVDVRFQGGGEATYLMDVPAEGVIAIDSAGETHPVQVAG